VEDSPQPGDILYFGYLADEEPEDRQVGRFANINHAAISLGGDELIHATGAVWGVTHNSLDPASPRYRPWLHTHLAGVRRFS
jgi:cell wall-associated NlpC family hydrolase